MLGDPVLPKSTEGRKFIAGYRSYSLGFACGSRRCAKTNRWPVVNSGIYDILLVCWELVYLNLSLPLIVWYGGVNFLRQMIRRQDRDPTPRVDPAVLMVFGFRVSGFSSILSVTLPRCSPTRSRNSRVAAARLMMPTSSSNPYSPYSPICVTSTENLAIMSSTSQEPTEI